MLMSWEMSLQCRWSLLLVSSGELWSSPVSYSWWGRGQAAAGDITPRIYIFTACHSAQPPSAAQRAGYRTTAPPPATTTIWTSTAVHNINLRTLSRKEFVKNLCNLKQNWNFLWFFKGKKKEKKMVEWLVKIIHRLSNIKITWMHQKKPSRICTTHPFDLQLPSSPKFKLHNYKPNQNSIDHTRVNNDGPSKISPPRNSTNP